jgi:hypothetical protein
LPVMPKCRPSHKSNKSKVRRKIGVRVGFKVIDYRLETSLSFEFRLRRSFALPVTPKCRPS